MSTLNHLSHAADCPAPTLYRWVSQGVVHLDGGRAGRGRARLNLTGGDALRLCACAGLTKLGLPHGPAGALANRLSLTPPNVIEADGRRVPVGSAMIAWPDSDGAWNGLIGSVEDGAKIARRPDVPGLVILPLDRPLAQVEQAAQAERDAASSPDQNGWSRAFRRADGDHR